MAALHLRIIVPSVNTSAVRTILTDHKGVTNIIVLSEVARQPPGDVVMCDVARDSANEVLESLEQLGLGDDGSIALEHVDFAESDTEEHAKVAAAGEGEDAVVWEEFAGRIDESSRLTWSYVAFLAIALHIAAIGILRDSSIMIVGAMVLGPEFGPVAALCFGVLRREWWRVGIAARTLALGFVAAIAITCLIVFVSDQLGAINPTSLDSHANTDFIVKPDSWSFIVAALAGIAGILSLTSEKSSALVGVFISVTTVPAASSVAVAIALARWGEVAPSLTQLAVNLAGIFVAGLATLLVLWMAWGRAGLGARLNSPSAKH